MLLAPPDVEQHQPRPSGIALAVVQHNSGSKDFKMEFGAFNKRQAANVGQTLAIFLCVKWERQDKVDSARHC